MSNAALKRARTNQTRNVERALREERTGLVAVARAFLEESPDPERLLRRLAAMVRQAETAGASARTRDALRYGHAVLLRAQEQAQGRPQSLFEPDVGHVSPKAVEALAHINGEAQQEPLRLDTDPLGIRGTADEALRVVRDGILRCLRESGSLSDLDLVADYQMRVGPVTRARLLTERRELTRLGRVVRDNDGEGQWKLLEQ